MPDLYTLQPVDLQGRKLVDLSQISCLNRVPAFESPVGHQASFRQTAESASFEPTTIRLRLGP